MHIGKVLVSAFPDRRPPAACTRGGGVCVPGRPPAAFERSNALPLGLTLSVITACTFSDSNSLSQELYPMDFLASVTEMYFMPDSSDSRVQKLSVKGGEGYFRETVQFHLAANNYVVTMWVPYAVCPCLHSGISCSPSTLISPTSFSPPPSSALPLSARLRRRGCRSNWMSRPRVSAGTATLMSTSSVVWDQVALTPAPCSGQHGRPTWHGCAGQAKMGVGLGCFRMRDVRAHLLEPGLGTDCRYARWPMRGDGLRGRAKTRTVNVQHDDC